VPEPVPPVLLDPLVLVPVPDAPPEPIVPVFEVSIILVSDMVVSIMEVSIDAESPLPSPLLFELHAAKTIPVNARVIKALNFIVF
jgi:hypothetical protein